MRRVSLIVPVVLGLVACSSEGATPAAPAPSVVPVEAPRSAPGTGSVRGVVAFADKPVGGINVMLCRSMGSIAGCQDKVATTTTGSDGTYTFKDVPVGPYGGVGAQVFDTDRYVFMADVVKLVGEGMAVTENGVVEMSPLPLFKDDLAITTPKVNQKVAPTDVTVAWKPYPDAASYVVYLGEVKEGGAGFYVEEKTTTPSLTVKGPLAPGKYSFSVDARTAKGDRLATSTTYRLFFVK